MGASERVIEQLVGNDTLEEMCRVLRECPPGCVVEVGVYQGGSARWLYEVCEEQHRSLFLYDTFRGIPFQGPGDSHKVGDFGDTDIETVSKMLPKSVVIQGVFPDSMVKMPRVAFAHLDCDQYKSIKDAIYALTPLMVEGGIMWFDDVGCLDGANKAFNEWREETGMDAYKAKCGKYFARF
jgi:hypothetical protein